MFSAVKCEQRVLSTQKSSEYTEDLQNMEVHLCVAERQ